MSPDTTPISRSDRPRCMAQAVGAEVPVGTGLNHGLPVSGLARTHLPETLRRVGSMIGGTPYEVNHGPGTAAGLPGWVSGSVLGTRTGTQSPGRDDTT